VVHLRAQHPFVKYMYPRVIATHDSSNESCQYAARLACMTSGQPPAPDPVPRYMRSPQDLAARCPHRTKAHGW
jgi:hypothetical protein